MRTLREEQNRPPKSAALTDSVETEPTTAVTTDKRWCRRVVRRLPGRRAKEADGLASRARQPEEAISETVG